MNTKKIASLIAAIENADVLTVDSSPLLNASVYDVTGEADNEVVNIRWSEEDGLEYSCSITEGAFNDATLEDGRILVKDDAGDTVEIALFTLTKKVVVEDWN